MAVKMRLYMVQGIERLRSIDRPEKLPKVSDISIVIKEYWYEGLKLFEVL